MNFAASAGKAQDASGTPLKAVQIDGQVRASPGRGGFSRVGVSSRGSPTRAASPLTLFHL
jgi:hypothetical protein